MANGSGVGSVRRQFTSSGALPRYVMLDTRVVMFVSLNTYMFIANVVGCIVLRAPSKSRHMLTVGSNPGTDNRRYCPAICCACGIVALCFVRC